VGTLSPWVNQPGRDADHSSPSNAEVKNGGTIPSLTHVFKAQCLIKHRDSFTFFKDLYSDILKMNELIKKRNLGK
jgi:hypothetical protein